MLATKAGIAPELMIEILENSAAKSGIASYKAPFILNRDFVTNFSAKWMHKDVGFALELAKSLDLPLPMTAVTHQMLQATIAKGWGDDDFCSCNPCFGRLGQDRSVKRPRAVCYQLITGP